MKVEFTKNSEKEHQSLKVSINERLDNLDINNLGYEKKSLLEKYMSRPDLVFKLSEFQLLSEMAAETKKLWKPSQTLNVFFIGGSTIIKKRVLEYASIWSQYCSLTFTETNTAENSHIRISFDAPGSWSFIGTDAFLIPKNQATINFGWLSDTLDENNFKQVVLHEFGHAIGLIHEHQSPAVEIRWKKDFVYNYFNFNYNWSKNDVDRNLFQEFEKTTIKYSTLDTDSIMGYFIPKEFTEDEQVFPQNFDLSEMDKKYIGELYPKLLLS